MIIKHSGWERLLIYKQCAVVIETIELVIVNLASGWTSYNGLGHRSGGVEEMNHLIEILTWWYVYFVLFDDFDIITW
jgi:hypothetical protein